VDDHQTTNAKFLVDAGGGWLVQQRDLSPQWLAGLLQSIERPELIRKALAAKSMQKTDATGEVIAACEELAAT
jgi:UDP-N-acetylglucosamine--N-acetylmuramyl-(pentapeptide) pyrophosphoryl-undecaprenol N-acetylglucosamine transferase